MAMVDILDVLVAIIGSSSLTSFIMFLIQRHDRKKENEEADTSARAKMLIGLGHDRILWITDKIIDRGCITLKEKRNLKYLYEPYKELGGNGDCEIGYEACQKLPVVSEKELKEMSDNNGKRNRNT